MGYQLAVQLRYAVALAGRYPLLAGADLDVRAGEILVLKGCQRRRQDQPSTGRGRPAAPVGRGGDRSWTGPDLR